MKRKDEGENREKGLDDGDGEPKKNAEALHAIQISCGSDAFFLS